VAALLTKPASNQSSVWHVESTLIGVAYLVLFYVTTWKW